jgi:hypothetical protein
MNRRFTFFDSLDSKIKGMESGDASPHSKNNGSDADMSSLPFFVVRCSLFDVISSG